MYFPYLRGRQFELIAIRELLQQSLLSKFVIPVIEPVNLSSSLIKTMVVFQQNDRKLGIVHNPQVGNMHDDLADNEKKNNIDKYEKLLMHPPFVPLFYVDANISENRTIIEVSDFDISDIVTICDNQDAIQHFEACFISDYPKYNFIPDESVFRRRLPKQKVLFEARFEKKSRNVDYANITDEPFSSDHIYYEQDGYVGFSDYSVIGAVYSNTGFAPYAVAIHIVYFDKEKNLRIHHFVSKTNDDITDPAGKFAEALEKLVEWNQTQKLDTNAIRSLEEMYSKHIYPGLGTVKKLSIMHHLELMSKYLDEVVSK